jgi:hypothetical protein
LFTMSRVVILYTLLSNPCVFIVLSFDCAHSVILFLLLY